MSHNPTPMKAQFLPLFNVNLSQLQLNSTSTQVQLNFDTISSQPHFKSTSTITSTQYGCDIKATQSCSYISLTWDQPFCIVLSYHPLILFTTSIALGKRFELLGRKMKPCKSPLNVKSLPAVCDIQLKEVRDICFVTLRPKI